MVVTSQLMFTWWVVALFQLPVDPLLPPLLLLRDAPGLALVYAGVAVVAVQGREVLALAGLLVETEAALLAAADVAWSGIKGIKKCDKLFLF